MCFFQIYFCEGISCSVISGAYKTMIYLSRFLAQFSHDDLEIHALLSRLKL